NLLGRPRNLYRRDDIEQILATPATHGRVLDAAGTWIDGNVAREEFGLSGTQLAQLRRQRSRHLGGMKLRAKKVLTVARGGAGESRSMRIWFYLESDLVQFAQAKNQEGASWSSCSWLTAGEARRRFGFGRDSLWYWRTQGCPYLDGRKLQAKRVPAAIHRK